MNDHDMPGTTSNTETGQLLRDAAGRALRYLADLDDRPVAPDGAALERLAALGGPMPETGRDPAAVLDRLDEIGGPATVASAGPRGEDAPRDLPDHVPGRLERLVVEQCRRDRPHGRRLAGTVGAEQNDDLAGMDRQRDLVQDGAVGVGKADIDNAQHGATEQANAAISRCSRFTNRNNTRNVGSECRHRHAT